MTKNFFSKYKFLKIIIVLIAIGLGLSGQVKLPLKNTPDQMIQPSPSEFNIVLKVVDGDTIDVELSGKKEAVRLVGIDTPEVVDPRKSVQCFGKEASAKAKEILSGKRVRLEQDPTQGNRDKYGRLLRFVFLEDGTNFNKLMIDQGFAHEYTYQSNPYKYQKEFIEAEKLARENKKGLWADGVCENNVKN
ncbi:MAG: thermonuclease family protein [bacterium]|nr:thermonuclease family protein [bacterium]